MSATTKGVGEVFLLADEQGNLRIVINRGEKQLSAVVNGRQLQEDLARVLGEDEDTRFVEEGDGEYWECSKCGLAWFFDTGEPEENECYYCPKCGSKFAVYIREG